ncbi:hypothetical protein CUJ84_pRLN1000797 (plasmid) [Rhizobium leguminosarum]|uniref:Uncharacterized protein n=1 Tax=Rhizobium leguminosarum TaxID=384 RepID=A0A2K9ZDD0_RHILE|nr:hypothetical protein CUJ84_pRLN1000797 [Rhizobium leguminosarum]
MQRLLAVEPQGVADMMSLAVLEHDLSIDVAKSGSGPGCPYLIVAADARFPVVALQPIGRETRPRRNMA